MAVAPVFSSTGVGSETAGLGHDIDKNRRTSLSKDATEELVDGNLLDALVENFDNYFHYRRGVSAERKFQREHPLRHWLHHLCRFIFHTVVVFVVAWLYKKHWPICLPQGLASKQDPESGAIVFAYGLFDEKRACTEDVKLCVCSWCCVNIQWANNVSNSQMKLFSSFWFALVVSTLNSYQLAIMTRGISYLLWVPVAVYCRQRLREKFGLQHSSLMTLAQDILVWSCCCSCSVAQESRQLEHVRTLLESQDDEGDLP